MDAARGVRTASRQACGGRMASRRAWRTGVVYARLRVDGGVHMSALHARAARSTAISTLRPHLTATRVAAPTPLGTGDDRTSTRPQLL